MTANKSPQENVLWKRWLESKDNEAANALVEHYMDLVTFHTERISAHLPSNVSRDDVRSFGLMGLFDALKKFDPKRDLKFDTYASFRVRGAIMDGLRHEDWLPRSTREKTKKMEKISQTLEQQLHREPSADEIAEKLGITTKEVENLVRDSLFANVLSIEEKPKNNANESVEGIGFIIPDEATPTPDDHLMQSEWHEDLAYGIKSLNQNEQLVVSLFYHDELTLTEIGDILNLTTSRISQIHRKAIFKLRKILNKVSSL